MDLDKRDELLFQILTELHLIRLALTEEGNTQALYRCTECDTQIFGDELEHHAQRQHKWQLAEGGQPNSESNQGGSASFDTTQSDDYLSMTHYGETAKRHIRYDESIAIVRSY